MAWIQVHQTLKDHRKVYAAADALGVELAHMLGMIVSFWLWALDNAPSGTLDDISNRMIARAAQWTGNADEFVEVLKSADLLDETPDGELELHDWKEYTGSLIEKREAEKQRSRKRRESKTTAGQTTDRPRTDRGQTTDEPRTDHGQTTDRPRTDRGQTTDRPRTDRGQTDGRVEKSRVEYILGGNNPPYPPNVQTERFAAFWKLYPKKQGKGAAEKAWKKIKPTAEMFDQIMAAVGAAISSEQWQRENGRFIPNPATWLNQKRWEDEIPAPAYFQPPAGGKPNTMDVLAGIIAAEEGGTPL